VSERTAEAEAVVAASSPSGAPSPRLRAASELLPRRPYPGLRPFEKAEWPIFRGRDRLVQDILTVLAENHFASVIGPSGSGKSSLVRAGVLATLERRHSRMGVRWRTGTMRPGVSPLWSMAEGILRSLRADLVAPDGELPAAEVARLRVLIGSSEDGLAVLTREFSLKEHENFLLLVDQFEEIFRYRSDQEDEERARLVELLVAVANARLPGLYIITTMRSEYLGDCARFTGLAETLNETHYLLPRMTEEELRQAILEPAELKNGRIQDELVDRLINDIRSQEDQLPILQHTLLWMWIQEEESREREELGDRAPIHLGLAEYEQLQADTTAKTALSRHGDKILEGMSLEERRVAEVMFRRLVEVEEHSDRLRRPTRCGTIARLAQVLLDVVQRVVDAFRAEDASFVYASRQIIGDDTSIDITHESLIRQWDTLDGWVRQEKAAYEVYNDLCRAAQRMREGQRNLLDGLELSRALLWAAHEQPTRLWARRYGGDFDAAISFLTDSEDAEEQRRRAQTKAEEAARRQEEERLQRENELKQQALRARLEQQALRTRLAVAAAVVGAILTAAATGAFWYAHNQKLRADAAAEQALAEARRADAAVIETKASSLWSALQLWRDPLTPEDVATFGI
jgi:energy-coupling factor transporter ATP-binding protein EcfA2